jgi:hypothetical protein
MEFPRSMAMTTGEWLPKAAVERCLEAVTPVAGDVAMSCFIGGAEVLLECMIDSEIDVK